VLQAQSGADVRRSTIFLCDAPILRYPWLPAHVIKKLTEESASGNKTPNKK